MILSNSPSIDQVFQSSQYYTKQRDRQGKLPFTRRLNKGKNLADRSLTCTINPFTGEPINNPYLNISLEGPNERMKRNLDRLAEEDIVNIRAKRIISKESHKLGLNKDHEAHPK
jgi:hypothetical protein